MIWRNFCKNRERILSDLRKFTLRCYVPAIITWNQLYQVYAVMCFRVIFFKKEILQFSTPCDLVLQNWVVTHLLFSSSIFWSFCNETSAWRNWASAISLWVSSIFCLLSAKSFKAFPKSIVDSGVGSGAGNESPVKSNPGSTEFPISRANLVNSLWRSLAEFRVLELKLQRFFEMFSRKM